jgi:hypothetical protein
MGEDPEKKRATTECFATEERESLDEILLINSTGTPGKKHKIDPEN